MADKLTTPLESATRTIINNQLENLGWKIDESDPKCNCFTERTRTDEEKKKLENKRPDYILYNSEFPYKPLAIIEAKKSGGDLEDALEQAIKKYAKPLNINIVFVTDGSIIQAYHLGDKGYLYYNSELITKFLSEEQLKLFVSNGSKIFSKEKTIHSKMGLIETFMDADEILRNDGLSEGRERFMEFSNLLFLKLISDIETEREERNEKRRLKKVHCWDHYCTKDSQELEEYINKIVLPELDKKYNNSSDIFNNQLSINDKKNLKKIVDKITKLGNLLDTDSDIKGDAFEYFLKKSISVGNDLGEYFTPRHIVKLMIDFIDLKVDEKVYDPCCGTGGFLIEAFKDIKNKCRQTPENISKLEKDTVFGREISTTSKIAKMNMIIMGDGHNNVEQKDCLKSPVKEEYDVCLSNIPFSQETDSAPLYGFTTKDANPIFIKHIYDSLKSDGRCAVVVPEGLLFDEKTEYVKIRQLLIDKANLYAVIKLHRFVFAPYTKQPTSILFFKKGETTKKIWFYDVKNDGFALTDSKKGRKNISEDDLIRLRQIWKEKIETENSFFISTEKIRKTSYKLSMDGYIKKAKNIKSVKLRELLEDNKVIIGYTPDRNRDDFWFGGKHVWVKIEDMSDEMYISSSEEKITDVAIKNGKKLPKDTLLFSFKLTIGKVAITKKSLFTNEAIAGLIIKDPIIRKYLYYILPKLDYNTNRTTKGKTLNKKSIENIDIPYDDNKKEIEKMVKKLDDIEKKKQQYLKKISNLNQSKDKIINQRMRQFS